MQVDLKATNIDLTDAIRDAVQKHMDGLDAIVERFGTAVRSEFEVSRTTNHHAKGDVFRAEVHVLLPGKPVYAEATHEDLYVAMNDAKKEAERQILSYKGILSDKRTHGASEE